MHGAADANSEPSQTQEILELHEKSYSGKICQGYDKLIGQGVANQILFYCGTDYNVLLL